MVHQAEVEKFATGCNGLSPLSRRTGTRFQSNTAAVPPSRKIQYSTVKTATINVRTLQDDIKLACIIKAAQDLQIDILCMQETRRLGFGSISFQDESLHGWQLIWSGMKRKKMYGVAILLAPHVHLEKYTEHLPCRIISATICCKGLKLAVLNGYAPTNDAKESTKSTFYSALGKAKKDLDADPKYKVLTAGDFNATISSSSKESGAWDNVLGYNNSDRVETNNNGERFLKWCLHHNMKIMNSFFRTKRIHRGTWRHPRTRKWKRIDYMCTTGWISKFVKLCRVYVGPSSLFDTDHRLLVMDIKFPSSKKQLHYHLSRQHNTDDVVKTNFQALRGDEELQRILTENIDSSL